MTFLFLLDQLEQGFSILKRFGLVHTLYCSFLSFFKNVLPKIYYKYQRLHIAYVRVLINNKMNIRVLTFKVKKWNITNIFKVTNYIAVVHSFSLPHRTLLERMYS